MTERPRATRAACFQPDNYSEIRLFANRTETREELAEIIASYIAPGSPGEGRVLIRGNRGVGKSILTRSALNDVLKEYGPLVVTVDGARTAHGPEAFLRQLARDLGREAQGNSLSDSIVKQGEMLVRIASTNTIKTQQVQTWTKAMKIGLEMGQNFMDKVRLEFGMARAIGTSRSVEESYERAVSVELLQELIQALLTDCRVAGLNVILFLDNLDQVGYAEIEEDIRRVTDLARHLFSLRDCLVVANLRTEFVSRDLRKLYSVEFHVEGMTDDELMEVVEKRISTAGELQREALDALGFVDLARTLARLTDNAWGLLTWLAFLDQQRIDFEPTDTEALQKKLRRFAELRYTGGVSWEELLQIAARFKGHCAEFQSESSLKYHSGDLAGLSPELIVRALKYGVLIPDWLLSPDRYMLSPGLHFLAHEG